MQPTNRQTNTASGATAATLKPPFAVRITVDVRPPSSPGAKREVRMVLETRTRQQGTKAQASPLTSTVEGKTP